MDLQTLERLRGSAAGCPSDLDLDQLSSDELEAPAAARILEHVAGCADCASRMELRKAGFASFPQVDPRPLLAAIRRRVGQEEEKKTRRSFCLRPATWLATPLCAAAVLAIIFLARREDPTTYPQPESGVRAKGGLALHVHRLINGRSQRVLSGDIFHPGDQLRFVVDLPSPGQINVLGIEEKGGLYVGWPSDASVSTLRSGGRGQELPGAVSLDGSLGREAIYLAHCPAAVGVPSVVCHTGGAGQPPACPQGCTLTPFILNKQ
jgi:hypothetical protein